VDSAELARLGSVGMGDVLGHGGLESHAWAMSPEQQQSVLRVDSPARRPRQSRHLCLRAVPNLGVGL
jgi:hypothetical protein